MIVKQNTIAYPVTVTGKGLHTGVEVSLTFKPAPENFGFKFKRVDLEGEPEIEANVSKVRGTARGTVLKDGEVSISTIEHCMSALISSDIDNVLMEINLDADREAVWIRGEKQIVRPTRKPCNTRVGERTCSKKNLPRRS